MGGIVESFSPRPANTGAIAVVGLAFNVGEKKIRKKKDVKADKNGMNTNGDRRRHVTGENRYVFFGIRCWIIISEKWGVVTSSALL